MHEHQGGWGYEVQFDATGKLLFVRREASAKTPDDPTWGLYELAAGSDAVLLWPQRDTNYSVISLAFPANGASFLAWAADRSTGRNLAVAVSTETGQEIWRDNTPRVSRWDLIHLDPAGEWCAYPSQADHRLRSLVRVSDGQKSAGFLTNCYGLGPQGQSYVHSLANDEGRDDWTVNSIADGGRVVPIGFDGAYSQDTVRFSADGRLLAWGTIEGVVYVADIEVVRQRIAELHR